MPCTQSYGLSTHVKHTPSAFSEKVAGVAGGHGYKVHDVTETFWLDFGQTIDRSWQQYASVYIYIYIYIYIC